MSIGKRGVVLGKVLLTEAVISGVLLLFAAYVTLKVCPSDQVLNYVVIAIYAVSAFVGGMIAGKNMENRRFIWGLCAGMLYVFVVMIIALSVRGNVSSGSVGLLKLIIPSLLAGMAGGILS